MAPHPGQSGVGQRLREAATGASTHTDTSATQRAAWVACRRHSHQTVAGFQHRLVHVLSVQVASSHAGGAGPAAHQQTHRRIRISQAGRESREEKASVYIQFVGRCRGEYLLALVRSDQASEPTVARAYIGELPRDDCEARVRPAIAHEVVFCRVEIRARRAVEI